MRKFILSALLLPVCFGAAAESIDCVALKKNNNLELVLKKSEGFENCFFIEDLPANADVQVVAFSNDAVENKITLYDLNQGGNSSYIAEYHSSAGSSNGFLVNTSNRTLSFRVTPTSHTSSDKNLSVSYLIVDGVGQIIFDIDDIPSSSSTAPPTGDCTYDANGERTCYDVQ